MATWTLDDIPWQDFEPAKVNGDVLKVIKAAALVERNGADYGQYLASVFHDDAEFQNAAKEWAIEEEQHGRVLGRWAELADPTFNLDTAFAHFTELYKIPIESDESVRGSLAGELCARCVVEAGTSSFYSAIRDQVDEPVLRVICKKIAADEFRHYKLFSRHLALYQARESLSTWQRFKVVVTRFQETSDDELASAYYAGNALDEPYDCRRANDAYAARAMAFYRHKHVRRAGYMMAETAGLTPNGWLTRALTWVLWRIIEAKGRAYRAILAS